MYGLSSLHAIPVHNLQWHMSARQKTLFKPFTDLLKTLFNQY